MSRIGGNSNEMDTHVLLSAGVPHCRIEVSLHPGIRRRKVPLVATTPFFIAN